MFSVLFQTSDSMLLLFKHRVATLYHPQSSVLKKKLMTQLTKRICAKVLICLQNVCSQITPKTPACPLRFVRLSSSTEYVLSPPNLSLSRLLKIASPQDFFTDRRCVSEHLNNGFKAGAMFTCRLYLSRCGNSFSRA